MKKCLILLFSFIFLFLVLPKTAKAASLSLSPATGTLNIGCTYSLDVVLDTAGAQTDGTDAILNFDSTRFSINSNSIIPNTNIYPDFPGNNVDESSGKITISGLASVSSAFSGKGTLATLRFVVKDQAPTGATQITFEFDPNDKAKTTDSNVVERNTVVDVLNSVTNGSFVIGKGACGSNIASPLPQGADSVSTPAGQLKNLDQLVDKTGKGTGTVELTSVVAIVGGVLTILGILGLALL